METVVASDVARRAMSAVELGARSDWIGLFAQDAVLEDPVDDNPGHVGRAAIADFWDAGIAMFSTVWFDVRRTYDAPGEVLVLADVVVTIPGGAKASYDAAVHYRINALGEIASLRAFWDLQSMLSQLARPVAR